MLFHPWQIYSREKARKGDCEGNHVQADSLLTLSPALKIWTGISHTESGAWGFGRQCLVAAQQLVHESL